MMTYIKKYTLISVFLISLCGTLSEACDTPVFQYALGYWRTDAYRGTVYHNKELTPQATEILKSLSQYSMCEQRCANLLIQNGGAIPTELSSLEKVGNGPVFTINFPYNSGVSDTLYAGPLNKEAILSVMDSPVRRKIYKLLVQGDSVVWLFVESGDKDKDDEALEFLRQELENFRKTWVFPDGPWYPSFQEQSSLVEQQDDTKEQQTNNDAMQERLKFPIISVSRDNPQEKYFLKMLMLSEIDLQEYKNEPMVFPIFGKGLVLYALVGEGINPETIYETCAFLGGACACEVKYQNPGMDLLMTCNWQEGISNLSVFEQQMPLWGLGGGLISGRDSNDESEQSPTQTVEDQNEELNTLNNSQPPSGSTSLFSLNAIGGILLLILAIGAVSVIIVGFIIVRRKKT